MSNRQLIIDVTKLNKSFADRHVIKDVSIQVRQGEIFGFLGPNGSGKTTTIRMLCGLLTPDSGRGTCLGYDILTQTAAIKQHVGYMTQEFSFYEDLTIQENLDFIAQIYAIPHKSASVSEVIAQLGLTPKRQQLTGSLSGGWKQRLALAACMLHQPRLLLLDEPTAGVDPKARREFWDQIHALSQQGITSLVSTHYMDEAQRCTQLGYISNGRLLVQGTISEVINSVNLTTWCIQGANVASLRNTLKTLPGVTQVAIFGDKLHVSGHNAKLLHSSLATCSMLNSYAKHSIQPGLEDAFISLVTQTNDQD